MKFKIILQLAPLIFMITAIACGSPKKTIEEPISENRDTLDGIKNLNWMIGNWEMNNNPGLTTETWVLRNDSVLSGTSLTVGSGKDTLFFETITIEQRGKEVYYIPVVKDQNDGKPTRFTLILNESIRPDMKEARFINTGHDFPQTVSYTLKDDSLIAEISGLMDGNQHSEKFPMKRSK